MEKKTVAQVAVQVLKSAQSPMTAADVTHMIIDQSLYTFNAKNPRQIVRSAIERRCEGGSGKTVSPTFFKKLEDGRYALK